MNGNASFLGLGRVLAASLTLWGSGLSLTGTEVTITQTNWAERWITNVIEVRMPVNRFVNEYRTNWVTQLRTNVVDAYVTNWVMRKLTNQVQVEATWTNHVTAYQTNWNTRTMTNHVALNLVRTNFVDRLQTNWSTLNLTNWQTVVLFKTNWLTQAVTNLVQIDLPSRPIVAAAAPSEVVEPKDAPVETATPALAAVWAGPLAIEADRTARPSANDLVEVQMKVRHTDNTGAPPQVQQWRVEREDGAILLFGQDQEFKRGLPVGNYKVEAKMKVEGDNPPLSVRGTLSVTTRETVVQPRLLVRK
jgi:hypothetical protein